MKYIYSITEKNVDGCGGDATELVSSESPLTIAEQQLLETCLSMTKQKAVNDDADYDTADMIAEALEMFQDKTGKLLKFANDAIEGYLTF